MDNTAASPTQPKPANRTPDLAGLALDVSLMILILTGIFFRFNWINWSQGANLHPDEYGLTNTLTQLAIPNTLGDYFNTRLSSISPYQKYDLQGGVIAAGPDNRMRWGQLPIIIIRWAGEMSGNAGYNEIRLLGRSLSALADTLTLLFIFLIGRKLYGQRVGLLAAALSALAVMQIQQSHFMTVDNFGTLFTTLGLFACVQIAARPPVMRLPGGTAYRMQPGIWAWYLLFGAAFGLALATKVNLLPVGGMVLVAAFISIADLKLRQEADLLRILSLCAALLVLAFASTGLVFRVSQPMSFRAESGDTTIFSLHLNPDWVDSMRVASDESSGIGGGPPGEQWAHRPAIIFPLTNMVVWGLGLVLGLAAWLAFGAALWQILRHGKNWRSHLLPLVWTGGYFLFMGTRWVKSVRYFLPIYPFLCLFAAWGLLVVWKWARQTENNPRRTGRSWFAGFLLSLTVLGTLAWAVVFVQAVYETPHTRIQATEWIFENIPGPFTLGYLAEDGSLHHEPLSAPDNLQISVLNPYTQSFRLPVNGQLFQVEMPHLQNSHANVLRLVIANDPDGSDPLGEARFSLAATSGDVTVPFQPVSLQAGTTYYLIASSENEEPVSISRAVIANESWDEGLPVPFDGRDPFGGLYNGRTMEIRWPDDEHKRETILTTLAESDYLILPSQRAIWSTCRIPMTYPMTMEYYRALFGGQLGFEQVAGFSAPLKLGPLWISDIGGTLAWNRVPALPLFNHSWLAAEEAFSIYDHPPVWIFRKRADFSLEKAATILGSVDLAKVVVQSPLDASGDWCPAR